MVEPNVRRTPRSRKRRGTLVVVLLALFVAGTPTLVAGFGDIIFDPANFAKNVQQVVNLLRQIDKAAEQIRQQQLMLALLRASVADALALAGQTLQVRLNESAGGSIESRYPIGFPKAAPAWLDTMRPTWMESQRQQLLHERDLSQHMHDQMAPTADRLTTIIEASNGVHAERGKLPGQVASAQAHNELLALYSGEVDKLLAVRALRARRHAEARAHQQSETAYRNARRNDLLIDWNPIEQVQPQGVRSPFHD